MVAGRNSVRTFGDRTHGPIWSTLIARVRPRPPRITPCQGHPRDKQEEVESAPGPPIDLVRAGGFSQSDPPSRTGLLPRL